MATARRLYLYVVAAIGLGLILSGAGTMVRLLLEAAGVPAGSVSIYEIPDPNANKEALSLAVGYLAIGLVLWLIHWGAVEQIAGRGDRAGVDERGSVVRSLFFALVLAYLLAIAAGDLVTALREWLSGPLGARNPDYLNGYWIVSVAANLALAIVLGLAWGYHAWIRARDIRLGSPLTEGAARIFRLYLYGAALVALTITVQALLSLAGTAVDAIGRPGYEGQAALLDPFGQPTPLTTATAAWWVWPVLSSLVTLGVVVPIWLSHFAFSNRLLRSPSAGPQERRSRIRFAYFVGVVLLAAGTILGQLSAGLAPVFGAVLGASDPSGNPAWRDLVVGMLIGIVALAILTWHGRAAVAEEMGSDPSAPAPGRVLEYSVALLGLAVMTWGAVTCLSSLFAILTGPYVFAVGESNDPRLWTAAQGIGYVAVALPVWLLPWLMSRRRARDKAEALASSRRYYLFAVVGTSVIAAAFALATCVYLVTRLVVGLSANLATDNVSSTLATLIVAAPVLAYHAVMLRADLRIGAEESEAPQLEPAVEPAGVARTTAAGEPAPSLAPLVAVEPAPAAELPGAPELVIVGPPGADLESLRNALGGWLPPGFSVEMRR
jgi:hypothetical protein